SSNFINRKGLEFTFSSKHCPEVIHWWISCTCSGCPPMSCTKGVWQCEHRPKS
ncbi:hypothetical protein PISMIDRAFT_119923, partial [Pisolithus microcarpus 441]